MELCRSGRLAAISRAFNGDDFRERWISANLFLFLPVVAFPRVFREVFTLGVVPRTFAE